MIPKVYHHIWIDLKNRPDLSGLPDDILLNLRAWQASEIGYTETFWLLPEIYKLCERVHRSDVAAAIRLCRYPAIQADIGRLLVLLIYGGLWVDLKLYPLRPFFNELIDYDLVTAEHFVKEDLPDPTGTLCNSFIAARPNHPTIAVALAMVTCNVLRRSKDNIYAVTGAPNLMNAIDQTVGLLGRHRTLGYREIWGNWFKLCGGSYNQGDMHWSTRWLRGEKPFLDDNELQVSP